MSDFVLNLAFVLGVNVKKSLNKSNKKSSRDKKFWNKVAKFYSPAMKSSESGYKVLVNEVLPYLTKDMKVLEIGCGTGQLTFLLADKVDKLIATDFSENMISICKKNNECKNVKFKVEDAHDLTFSDDKFDAVVIANVMHIVPNSDKVLSEIKRVLKKDGILFAPIFTTDTSKFNFRIWFLEKIGFKVYKKFSDKQYIKYMGNNGIKIISANMIKSEPSDECALIGRV